jgi:hypothetical protein
MNEELLGNSMTAQALSEQLQDKTPEQWAGWLQNNRNQSRRVPYRIPFQRINGGIFYAREELDKFVEFEKQRQLGTIKLTGRAAEVLRAYGGTTQGRHFKGGSAGPHVANDGTGVFVQAIINEPLMVFAMTAAQAIEFGTELIESGQAAQRINSKAAQPDERNTGEYEVIVDNPDITIKRRKQP